MNLELVESEMSSPLSDAEEIVRLKEEVRILRTQLNLLTEDVEAGGIKLRIAPLEP